MSYSAGHFFKFLRETTGCCEDVLQHTALSLEGLHRKLHLRVVHGREEEGKEGEEEFICLPPPISCCTLARVYPMEV